MKELYCIKSQTMAGYLMQKGCRLVKTDKDRNNPKYSVFLFEKTEKLFEYMTEFTKNK